MVARIPSSTNTQGSAASRMISPEREAELLRRWQAQRDEAALDALLQAFEPLCRSYVRQFSDKADPDDLLQEARAGLIRAIERYDPSFGNRLAAYAGHWIFEATQSYAMDQAPTVKVPTNARRRMSRKLKEAQSEKGEQFEFLDGLVNERAGAATQILSGNYVHSLDRPVSDSDDADSEMIDFLEDDTESPETATLETVTHEKQRSWLWEAIGKLREREQIILVRRYFSDPSWTLVELADLLNVSKERVRQIEMTAFRRMRRMREDPRYRMSIELE